VKLFFFKSEKVDDSNYNGGHISSQPLIEKKNELLPTVPLEKAITGTVYYRKFFIIPEYTCPTLRIFLDAPSLANDNCLIQQGTCTDKQSDVIDYTEWKGTGILQDTLDNSIAITSFSVLSKISGQGFNVLDLVRISDGINKDFIRIKSLSWSGNIVTLVFFDDTFINSSYEVGANISACIERGRNNKMSVWIKENIPVEIGMYSNNINYIKGAF